MTPDHSGLQAVRARAYALAESGRFSNVHAVEQALVVEGWPQAGAALQSDYARKAISEKCQAAAKAL